MCCERRLGVFGMTMTYKRMPASIQFRLERPRQFRDRHVRIVN